LKPVDSDPRTWNVKRVDVAKDFRSVVEPGSLIRGLGALHRPWSRKNLTHADPQKNGAQTLMVGSGAGSVRLYDKHAETHGAVEEGTIRWETEARTDWAKNYGGVRCFGQLDSVSVERLARDRWEWSQMGVEVAGSMGRLVQSVRDSELTSRERRAFLGWLVEQSAGLGDDDMGSATLAKYRRLQRELGIAAPADFGSMVYLFRKLGWRKGSRVAAFIAAWGIYSDSQGSGERTLDGYAAYWRQSRATSFREQELFRLAFPQHLTPEPLWRSIRRSVDRSADRDSVAGKVMTLRGTWAA
jgi:hypothetical protein